MTKRLLFLLPLVLAALFFLFRPHLHTKFPAPEQFVEMLGSQKFIQTREDKENLQFFTRLYEKNVGIENTTKIPKTLHIVWLGPESFPEHAIKSVRSWVEKHPAWEIKFWTDIDRIAPHPKMKTVLLEDKHLPHLLSHYYQSDNFAERSVLVRYEILFAEGGVAVDWNLQCLRSFEPLNGYDFFAALSELGPSIFSTSVFAENAVIGARSGHPILESSIEWIKKRWDSLEAAYPGQDRASTAARTQHRSFIALNEGILLRADRGGNRDILLPSSFLQTFAVPPAPGSFQPQNLAEKKLADTYETLEKNVSQTQFFLFFLAGLSLFLGVLFFIYKKPRGNSA